MTGEESLDRMIDDLDPGRMGIAFTKIAREWFINKNGELDIEKKVDADSLSVVTEALSEAGLDFSEV